MRIRMLQTVRPDLPFLAPPGTILRAGDVYEAKANKNGAVSGRCQNGELLGVKPKEFEFVSMPAYLFNVWATLEPDAVLNALIEEDGDGAEP